MEDREAREQAREEARPHIDQVCATLANVRDMLAGCREEYLQAAVQDPSRMVSYCNRILSIEALERHVHELIEAAVTLR